MLTKKLEQRKIILGEMLIRKGWLSETQLEQALAE